MGRGLLSARDTQLYPFSRGAYTPAECRVSNTMLFLYVPSNDDNNNHDLSLLSANYGPDP